MKDIRLAKDGGLLIRQKFGSGRGFGRLSVEVGYVNEFKNGIDYGARMEPGKF